MPADRTVSTHFLSLTLPRARRPASRLARGRASPCASPAAGGAARSLLVQLFSQPARPLEPGLSRGAAPKRLGPSCRARGPSLISFSMSSAKAGHRAHQGSRHGSPPRERVTSSRAQAFDTMACSRARVRARAARRGPSGTGARGLWAISESASNAARTCTRGSAGAPATAASNHSPYLAPRAPMLGGGDEVVLGREQAVQRRRGNLPAAAEPSVHASCAHAVHQENSSRANAAAYASRVSAEVRRGAIWVLYAGNEC